MGQVERSSSVEHKTISVRSNQKQNISERIKLPRKCTSKQHAVKWFLPKHFRSHITEQNRTEYIRSSWSDLIRSIRSGHSGHNIMKQLVRETDMRSSSTEDVTPPAGGREHVASDRAWPFSNSKYIQCQVCRKDAIPSVSPSAVGKLIPHLGACQVAARPISPVDRPETTETKSGGGRSSSSYQYDSQCELGTAVDRDG